MYSDFIPQLFVFCKITNLFWDNPYKLTLFTNSLTVYQYKSTAWENSFACGAIDRTCSIYISDVSHLYIGHAVSIYPTPPIYRCSLLVFRVLYERFSEEKPHYSIPVWCHFFTNNTKYLLNSHCQFTINHNCGTTASHWWSTWITIMKQVNHNCGHSKLNVY